MQLKQLLNDDDAVSPVIGVILMVAITVILAAVIGTFVLGLGDQVQTTSPQASFSFDFVNDRDDMSNDGILTITHDGGDSIPEEELSVTGTIANSTSSAISGYSGTNVADGDDMSAGDYVKLDVADDTTVRVVWSAPSGDTSSTLGEWTGPNA
jgi:flagellin-like protein